MQSFYIISSLTKSTDFPNRTLKYLLKFNHSTGGCVKAIRVKSIPKTTYKQYIYSLVHEKLLSNSFLKKKVGCITKWRFLPHCFQNEKKRKKETSPPNPAQIFQWAWEETSGRTESSSQGGLTLLAVRLC